jgi:hypothetical protein
MEPLDDEGRALVTEAKRRNKWGGLPHRYRSDSAASQLQPGQKVADSHAEATK